MNDSLISRSQNTSQVSYMAAKKNNNPFRTKSAQESYHTSSRGNYVNVGRSLTGNGIGGGCVEEFNPNEADEEDLLEY